MRPRLHPEMGTIVLSARIARQLTGLYHRAGQDYQITPSAAAAAAASNLPEEGFAMLRLALHSFAVYNNLGWASADWLSKVLEASHFGHSFRRCFFFDYKENRRPYPRVTNRGVQTSPKRRADSRRLGFDNE